MSDDAHKAKTTKKSKKHVYDPVAARKAHEERVAENVKRAFAEAEVNKFESNLPNQQIERLKKKLGRPSKYDPQFCELVVEIMKQGKSIASVACAIGVSRKILYEWAEAHKNFRDALDLGKDLAQQYWENLSQDMSNGEASQCDVKSKGNPGMVQFMMSRRFSDYHAKTQSTVTTDQTIKQTQTIFVFESQLSDGVIRQSQTVEETEFPLESIINDLTEELCPKESE